MELNKIHENFGNFQRERAFELLKLVEQAHDRYNESLKAKGEGDVNPISIDNCIEKDGKSECYSEYKDITKSPYKVLSNLVFTQIDWLSIKTLFKRKLLFGFVVRNIDTSDIYVVFRGTASLGEWISNVKFIQQSYTTISGGDLSGETHWGFRRTYERPETYGRSPAEVRKILWVTRWFDRVFLTGARPMKDIIETTLIKECPPGTPKQRIFITGHSLGGALATLATSHIIKLIDDNKISASPPILYTFASPRVGDSVFANNFSKLEECYRIANSEDIVPKIPIPTLLLIAGRTPPKSGTLSLIQTLLLIAGRTPPKSDALSFVQKLNSKVDFQHIGLPIYFTEQKKTVSDNHTIPVYLDALKPLNHS